MQVTHRVRIGSDLSMPSPSYMTLKKSLLHNFLFYYVSQLLITANTCPQKTIFMGIKVNLAHSLGGSSLRSSCPIGLACEEDMWEKDHILSQKTEKAAGTDLSFHTFLWVPPSMTKPLRAWGPPIRPQFLNTKNGSTFHCLMSLEFKRLHEFYSHILVKLQHL